ncbi:restriction endonuclease [Glutamicibacter sp. 2E12]|uniref:restriction endonuclease n=1 Tax=Glutamicibacter sp. 2E12 TaxID=3416181 RepID=UPI003CF0597F
MSNSIPPSTPPTTAPLADHVLWGDVMGSKLEELLWGLIEEMGANDMVWRAGSATGINAADGGRDIEATFTEPQEDGSLTSKRWWIEAKGRAGTISRSLVADSALTALAYSEVDVVAFCTNSVFSNPTQDWVREWNRSHEKPTLYLWDRENLSKLVRKYPLVAARTLPEALGDIQRLDLLLHRFNVLGEMPSAVDKEYFWDSQESITNHEDVAELIVMFLYSEGSLSTRPWMKLLPATAAPFALLVASYSMPMRIFHKLPRPLESQRAIRTAAHVIAGVLDYLEPGRIASLLENPPFVIPEDEQESHRRAVKVWHEHLLPFILGDLQLQLRDICATDCARVMTDPAAFAPPVDAKEFFRQLGRYPAKDSKQLIIFDTEKPCAVGIPLLAGEDCPVVRDVERSADFIGGLQEVLTFRQKHPDGQFLRFRNELQQ